MSQLRIHLFHSIVCLTKWLSKAFSFNDYRNNKTTVPSRDNSTPIFPQVAVHTKLQLVMGIIQMKQLIHSVVEHQPNHSIVVSIFNQINQYKSEVLVTARKTETKETTQELRREESLNRIDNGMDSALV